DLSLPDANGEILISNIISLAHDIPVIVLTGFGNKEFGFKSLSYGVSDYLLKDELTASQLSKSIIYSIERQKFSRRLNESEEKYKKLFQLSPVPMWIYDWESLQFLYVNDAAIHHYGYSKAEFLSKTIREIRPAEDLPKLYDAISERCALAENAPVAAKFRH